MKNTKQNQQKEKKHAQSWRKPGTGLQESSPRESQRKHFLHQQILICVMLPTKEAH